jgi:hypothetical protein
VSKQVTTTAKSGLIADNQYGKIYGSSPGGPTENQALTQKCVGAFSFLPIRSVCTALRCS